MTTVFLTIKLLKKWFYYWECGLIISKTLISWIRILAWILLIEWWGFSVDRLYILVLTRCLLLMGTSMKFIIVPKFFGPNAILIGGSIDIDDLFTSEETFSCILSNFSYSGVSQMLGHFENNSFFSSFDFKAFTIDWLFFFAWDIDSEIHDLENLAFLRV